MSLLLHCLFTFTKTNIMKEEIESKLSPQQRVVVDSLREQLGDDTVNILLEFGYEIGKADGVEMFFQQTKDILKEV